MKAKKDKEQMKKSKKREIISEIVFFPITPTKDGVVAFISFTFNNQLRIQDCALVTRPQGSYRLSYPIKRLANGKTVNAIYPIDKKLAKKIEEIILINYENFLLTKVKD